MATINPFSAIRPRPDLADRIAALPYDVYSSQEARKEVEREPLSFLSIDRAETQFPAGYDMYAPEVYEKARELLYGMLDMGEFIKDSKPNYYIYELTMNDRVQTGIVGCSSIDDYDDNIIKKHENTRADKEADRIRHVDKCSAQTGPIFLAYRSNDVINKVIEKVTGENEAIYDITGTDEIRHRAWIIDSDEDIETVRKAFSGINEIYIADGHHRCASAVRVAHMRRQSNPDYDGTEEFNFFLSVLFADDQLMIMDYNRVVKDLNGNSKEQFLDKISKVAEVQNLGEDLVYPEKKGDVSMYLDGEWYALRFKGAIPENPVDKLDVALLQDRVLSPILGIEDPKTDKRIDFVGGIRGLSELERRVDGGWAVAFAMFPTSIQELFDVADADLLMPPKSTWFEPKLKSGIFIHQI